jgi:orotidine-5'-phosphate decarboxylase
MKMMAGALRLAAAPAGMAPTDEAAAMEAMAEAMGDSMGEAMCSAPLLVPGLGAQGGDLAALRGSGRRAPALVNVSRGILYPSDGSTPGEAAEEWRAQIAAALGK